MRVRLTPFVLRTAARRWYTHPAMSARIRRPITHRDRVIAVLLAVAWTLAWVATGVALSMAR